MKNTKSIFLIETCVVLIAFCLFSDCAAPIRTVHFDLKTTAEISSKTVAAAPSKKRNLSSDYKNYIPDAAHPDQLQTRFIRLKIHVMDSTSGTQNFSPADGIPYISEIIDSANFDLAHNEKMWLPRGNKTPVLPPSYQFVRPTAADFYFHRDDSLYFYVVSGRNQNNYDQQVLKKYHVGGDSVIHLFFMPHHPDSLKSKSYKSGFDGIALGNSAKITGVFERWKTTRAHDFKGLINHEIGHILGISHAWAEDGCPDTPPHPQNCWAWSPNPPCDTAAYNNVMDYNAYSTAWTPCQIGRIQMGLADEKSRARLALRPDWCTLDERQTIVIRDSVDWLGAKDLNGNLRIAAGGRLKISTRISMPPDGKITVEIGGRLILTDGCRLHQACGKTWQGIDYQQVNSKKGSVKIVGNPVFENIEPKK